MPLQMWFRSRYVIKLIGLVIDWADRIVDLSPWTALEYCTGVQDVDETWICHAPESCGCQWNATYELQVLPVRGCQAMGSEARAALYAPSTLAPFVSLPQTFGGSTGYYSPITSDGTPTWVETAVKGCKKNKISKLRLKVY